MLGHKIAATRTTNAGLWMWGLGTTGQLGDSSILSKSSPVQVAVARRWVCMALAGSTAAAISNRNQLWMWGNNAQGQFGNGLVLSGQVPAQIASDKTWSSVSVGPNHAAAVTTSGQLWAWGLGTGGQLGQITSVTSTSSPVQIASDKTWANVAAGTSHTAAITTSGQIWAWGVGTGGVTAEITVAVNRSSPVQVASDKTWSSVASGSYHVVAMTTSGQLWAWGLGTSGQLGQITTATSRSSPVQVASDKTWASVDVGDTTNAAITTTGALWAWGLGTTGQLGQITAAVSASSPIQVASDKTWSSVSAGATHTAAITTSGQLWAWGLGTSGQLGQITAAVSTSSPVQVGHFANWSKVEAGHTFTAALPG